LNQDYYEFYKTRTSDFKKEIDKKRVDAENRSSLAALAGLAAQGDKDITKVSGNPSKKALTALEVYKK